MQQEIAETEQKELEKMELQLAKGNLDNLTDEALMNEQMLDRHRRRVSNQFQDYMYEVAMMNALDKRGGEGPDERRARRATSFKLTDWDEASGYSDEPFEVPDTIKYAETSHTKSTLDATIEAELEWSTNRSNHRIEAQEAEWNGRWTINGKQDKKGLKLPFMTKMLKKHAWMRQYWVDDGRCWRVPDEWHENWHSGLRTRLTDGTLLPNHIFAAAYRNAMKVWESCPLVDKPLGVQLRSTLMMPPSVSPSMWSYPGNITVLMNRRGQLDCFRVHALDRDVWWFGRLDLPKEVLDSIPLGFNIAAVPYGQDHLIFFTFQRVFLPTRDDPYGSCVQVRKSRLSEFEIERRFPPVPLAYFKPFSANKTVFVLGYEHSYDTHYKLLILDVDDKDNAIWKETTISLPLYWTEAVSAQDYPDTIRTEGTASICVTQDEAKVFVAVPDAEGMSIAIIDAASGDYQLEHFAVPPVWGASLFYDAPFNRLIMAGGLGVNSPEPLVRTLNLDDLTWHVLPADPIRPLPAYAASVNIGPSAFGVLGGLWLTGHKGVSLQPMTSIHIIHASDHEEEKRRRILLERHMEFAHEFEEGGLQDKAAKENEAPDAPTDQDEFEPTATKA